MIQKKYFRVKYGFSVNDQVSISENELDKAIYAQFKKTPVQLGDKFINGSNIIAIEPHYHKYTGWHDFYEPKDGDDWTQIKRDCPEFDGVIESHKNYVVGLIDTGRIPLIGKKDWESTENQIEDPKVKPIPEVAKLADILKKK